jgi:hypothetical protein
VKASNIDMAEFISIYRKDFLWPDRKVSFSRNSLNCTIAVPADLESTAIQAYLKKNEDHIGDAHRSPLKLGPCPTTEELEFDETETCLKTVRLQSAQGICQGIC